MFYEGDVSRGLYFLEKGNVELFSIETKALYEKIGKNNCFGLDVLMTKTARHWCSAITRSYLDLHVIKRWQFEELLNNFPKDKDMFREFAKEKFKQFNVL